MNEQDLPVQEHDEAIGEGLSRRRMLSGLGLAGLAIASSGLANTLNPAPVPTGRADPNGRFGGKVVLITGATSGIGEATAREFAREGATVHFCGRRTDVGEQVAQSIRASGGRATFQRADVRVPQDVQNFVQECVRRYGRIDVAYNNAGIFMSPMDLHEIPVENFDDHLFTNTRGIFVAMKYEIPVMRRQGGGVIVNMSSVAGFKGFAGTAQYNASKHGIVGLSKAAAIENAPHNIRVNTLSPLAVDTPQLRRSFAYQNVVASEAAKGFVTPRVMEPIEMARAVLFLADPASTMVTGMNLDVTGGQLA